MYEFIKRFEAQAKENPALALGVAAGFIASVAKLIDAVGGIRSKNAYANDRKRRAKNQ